MLTAIARAKDVFAEFTWDVEERVAAGDWIIAVGRRRGRGKGSGVEVEGRSANAGRIRHGQLVELMTGVPDRQAALEAVGLPD